MPQSKCAYYKHIKPWLSSAGDNTQIAHKPKKLYSSLLLWATILIIIKNRNYENFTSNFYENGRREHEHN